MRGSARHSRGDGAGRPGRSSTAHGPADAGPAREPGRTSSICGRRAIDRSVRCRGARSEQEDHGADGPIQRNVARDGGVGEILPTRRAVHIRALELLLHESAPLHY